MREPVTIREVPRILARADTPLGEWVLRQRQEDGRSIHEIIANGAFLMDDGDPSTERALTELTLAGIEARAVLVGGLGLGFTLRAVLAHPSVRRAVVAEIAEPLREWAEGPLAPWLGDLLADRRVAVCWADVLAVARTLAGQCDAIVLDVDNGPDFLVHASNAAIYTEDGLAVLRAALRRGGRLGIWSSTPAPDLASRLAGAFGAVEVHGLTVRRGGRSPQYWVLVAAV